MEEENGNRNMLRRRKREGNQQNKVKESFITNNSLTLEHNLNYVRKEYGLIEDMESNR